jgi:hypothetical protein
MTKELFHDPERWHGRAKEARALALEIADPVSRLKVLEIAESYESLARRAALKLRESKKSTDTEPRPCPLA